MLPDDFLCRLERVSVTLVLVVCRCSNHLVMRTLVSSSQPLLAARIVGSRLSFAATAIWHVRGTGAAGYRHPCAHGILRVRAYS
jgi:hypothetical protein